MTLTNTTTPQRSTSHVSIALRRAGLLPLYTAPASSQLLSALIVELSRLGVRITNPERLNDSVLTHFTTITDTVAELRGTTRTLAPLFKGFPDQLPDYDDAFVRFAIASIRLFTSVQDPDALRKDFVDNFTADDIRAAMDFSDIGWWPASSVPLDPDAAALAIAAEAALPRDRHVEWINLTLVDEADFDLAIAEFALACAHSTSSLNPGVTADLVSLIADGTANGISINEVPFREIRALFLTPLYDRAISGDNSALRELTSGVVSPDDILRVLAARSDSDVSLATKITFPKLTRRARRVILASLDASIYLHDIWRRPGLWRSLAKSLHAGEYATKYPNAYLAFNTLRSTRRDTSSPLSLFESALRANRLEDAIDELTTPELAGTLLRQLRRLAARVTTPPEAARLVSALTYAARAATPARLLDLRAVLTDNGASYPRLAITKSGSLIDVANKPGHLAIPASLLDRLVGAIDASITSLLAEKDSWAAERVWIDPALGSLLIPSQARSTSDARISLERGSRLALTFDQTVKTLRLFVHWTQPGRSLDNDDYWGDNRSDLDLSCVMLNDDFSFNSQVSWTNLASYGAVHSGDLTSAPPPHGASEFIDFDLAKIRARSATRDSARYLVPCIFRFAGPTFDALAEAYAGWMLRSDSSHAYKTFDPATVAAAFDLTGPNQVAMPFVYDTLTNEIIYLDAYSPGRSRYAHTTEGSSSYITRIARALSARAALRGNLEDLSTRNVVARGATIEYDRSRATITIGMDDSCSINATRAEQVLSSLA